MTYRKNMVLNYKIHEVQHFLYTLSGTKCVTKKLIISVANKLYCKKTKNRVYN